MRAKKSRRKVLAGLLMVLFLAGMAALFMVLGGPVIDLASDPAAFRAWVEELGWLGKLGYAGMMALQILVAFIPGEPLEIAGGYAFGFWEGTLWCMAGAIVGAVAVFAFVRKVGIKAVEAFFPREKIDALWFLRDEKRLTRTAFLLFLIPGTPKDLMTYCAGLTRMRLRDWLLICSLARIPSVVTSTASGGALGVSNRTMALAVLGATAVVSLAGALAFRRLARDSGRRLGRAPSIPGATVPSPTYPDRPRPDKCPPVGSLPDESPASGTGE